MTLQIQRLAILAAFLVLLEAPVGRNYALALDLTNRVLMLHTELTTTSIDSIERFTRDGTFQDRFAVNPNAAYSALASDGSRVFVLDYQNKQIQQYGLDGSFVGVFATFPLGATDIPRLEVDLAGNVYLAAVNGSTDAVRYNPSGAITATYSSPLGITYGIDADSDGTTYLRQGSTLYKCAANGTFISSFSLSQATGNGIDIAIDEARRILYLANQGSSGVLRYDISTGSPLFLGAFTTQIASNHAITGLSVEPGTGNVFAVDFGFVSGSSPVGFEFSPDGALVHTYNSPLSGFSYDILPIPGQVPEPTTTMLFGLALTSLLGIRRPCRL